MLLFLPVCIAGFIHVSMLQVWSEAAFDHLLPDGVHLHGWSGLAAAGHFRPLDAAGLERPGRGWQVRDGRTVQRHLPVHIRTLPHHCQVRQ